MRSGSETVPLFAWLPFLSLSTTSIPDSTSPTTVYFAVEEIAVAKHDEELAVPRVGVVGAGHADNAAPIGNVGELRLQVGVFGAAGAVAVLPIPGLRHEPGDDPVERYIVIELVAGELLEALSMLRRDVVA